MISRLAFASALFAVLAVAADKTWPVTEGDAHLRDFHFQTGQTMPDLKIHYRTLGTPRRDPSGTVRNAVLILHGTGGAGTTFLRDIFAGELFESGQPLDVTTYYVILPDGIGHGQSSKPGDGLRAKVPR
jgi:homoserine O-acetyltransferase